MLECLTLDIEKSKNLAMPMGPRLPMPSPVAARQHGDTTTGTDRWVSNP